MPVGKLQRVLRWEGPAGATFRLSRREVSSRYTQGKCKLRAARRRDVPAAGRQSKRL